MSEKSEGYRLHMLRRVQNRLSQNEPPEVLEAESVIAKFRKEQADARAQISRLSSPLKDSNMCPTCWFMHGRNAPLLAVPHPEDRRFDRMICRQCNYFEDRDARK